ncbi:hypothetical protein M3Y99_01762600 [Aphelenchoides fujianensis]|nr:hypothetical protein M3Y99_01762600 [Aphelenchoides fujianensis]
MKDVWIPISREENRVRRERLARYNRWRNGERSEELEREFGRRTPSPPPVRQPVGFGGGGFRPQFVPPFFSYARAPTVPLGPENPSTIRSARRGGARGGFRVQPVADPTGNPPPANPPVAPNAFAPPVAQPAARGGGRAPRGRGGGFMANNPSWRVRLRSLSPPLPIPAPVQPIVPTGRLHVRSWWRSRRLPACISPPPPVVKHTGRPVDLSSKFDDARFSDFRVLTDSGQLLPGERVKKTLLAVQSPFFAQLFRSEQAELLVPGVEAAVVRAFLLFLYRGRLADVQPHAIAILALAVDYEVRDLTHDLSEWLAANLQLADVFRLFSLVERHPEELRDLSEAVFEFARRNAVALAELPAFDAFRGGESEALCLSFRSNYCTCDGPCRFASY